MDFYDFDHARGRLNGSVFRYKGRPVYVNELDRITDREGNEKWFAHITDILSSKRITTGDVREDKHLDLSPVPLGFTSHDGVASYVTRRPSRVMKQGLSDNSITAIGCARDEVFTHGLDLRSKALGNAIKGMSCTMEDALHRIKHSGEVSFPLSRNWAISVGNSREDSPIIHYKFYGPVGKVSWEEKTITLNEGWEMLNETLKEEYLDVANN